MNISRNLMLCFSLLTLIFTSACKQESVTTYTIPKEENTAVVTPPATGQNTGATASTPSQMNALPGMAEQAERFPAPSMTAPSHWDEQPLGSMRKGSWKITKADGGSAEVSVLAFPGDVGGTLANINRWMEQVGLTPITEAQLPNVTESILIDGEDGLFVKLLGAQKSIIGGIITRSEGTWFFKWMGDTSLSEKEQPLFKEFLATVKFQ